MAVFLGSSCNNRLASVTLRVEHSALQELINYYTTKIGFVEVLSKTQSSEITALSIPQGTASGHTSCALNLNPVALKRYIGTNRSDTYWKIGLQLHDVDSAAEYMGISKGSQFMDIGYLKHMVDPAEFTIELLQTTFEGNKKDRNLLFGEALRVKYQKLIQHNLPPSQKSSLAATQPLSIGQITIRCSDKEKSLAFYQNVLGMKLLSIQDVSKFGFKLYFLAYTTDEPPTPDLNDVSIREWLWQRKYTQLEIQCKVSDVITPLTHNGYADPADDLHNLPSGLQSIQVEINEKNILEIVKKYQTFEAAVHEKKVVVAAAEMERMLIGSVRDPDGITIEIITLAGDP